MTSYSVSTPRWTVRVDVSPGGVILPSSARYVWRSVGRRSCRGGRRCGW